MELLKWSLGIDIMVQALIPQLRMHKHQSQNFNTQCKQHGLKMTQHGPSWSQQEGFKIASTSLNIGHLSMTVENGRKSCVLLRFVAVLGFGLQPPHDPDRNQRCNFTARSPWINTLPRFRTISKLATACTWFTWVST